MSWVIDVRPAGGYVRATTSGVHAAGDIDRLCTEVLAAGKAAGLERFLVDDRAMQPALSTMEIYRLPERLRELGLTPSARVAVVFPTGAAKTADWRFLDDRMVTSGGLDFRLFPDDEAAALAWLLAPPAPPPR